jgi:multiple sugar transport system ATP-binding protein
MTTLEATEGALHVDGISKAFGATGVLDNVFLTAKPAEFVALVGPSGCGKSTLLRIIAGLEQPDHGRVWLDGGDVTTKRAAERDMAMVFQSYALYPHLTARQNLMVPLAMRRLNAFERLPLIGSLSSRAKAVKASINADVERAAEALKIEGLLERKPGQLSGGQRQRVALGRALVRRPRAFLMDEPLSNLDASLRVHMRNEIVDLHRKAGVVTIYVTHDQEEALGMADRVAVMLGGRIVQIAAPAELYRNPAHVTVASFIGMPRINLMPAIVSASGKASCGGYVVATGVAPGAGPHITVGIRPENLELQGKAHTGSLPVRVERVEFLGAEALVHCRAEHSADPLIARMTPGLASEVSEYPAVHASARNNAILVFDGQGLRVVQSLAPAEAASNAA